MNIIKLYDNLMPDGNNPKMADFFNKRLKGKYAYWIKMRYIFPLDSLSYQTYIEYEQKDQIFFLGSEVLPHIDMYSEDECLYEFANKYIDICETEKINSIQEYYIANRFTIDYNLSYDKLRNFRSWLANELYSFNIDENGVLLDKYTSEQCHMLEYYKNDMYNDIVKYLSIFGKEASVVASNIGSSCGCCNTNLSSLNSNTLSFCDALSTYRSNIHILMVHTFENVDFWKSLNKDFIKLFKQYIDNMIKIGLNVVSSNDSYSDCDCNYTNSASNENILKSLSIALGYIINGEVSGHINYIHDALFNWADKLYDHMSWEVK